MFDFVLCFVFLKILPHTISYLLLDTTLGNEMGIIILNEKKLRHDVVK